jgi:hypothetical protein
MRCVRIEFNYFFKICLLECSFIGILALHFHSFYLIDFNVKSANVQ